MIGDTIAATLPELAAHAASLMRARVELCVAGSWQFNDASGREELTPGLVLWSGPARLRVSVAADDTITGVQEITLQRYLVTAPTEAIPEVGQWLHVVSDPDPYLTGRILAVTALTGGTVSYQRRFVAVDNLG